MCVRILIDSVYSSDCSLHHPPWIFSVDLNPGRSRSVGIFLVSKFKEPPGRIICANIGGNIGSSSIIVRNIVEGDLLDFVRMITVLK